MKALESRKSNTLYKLLSAVAGDTLCFYSRFCDNFSVDGSSVASHLSKDNLFGCRDLRY